MRARLGVSSGDAPLVRASVAKQLHHLQRVHRTTSEVAHYGKTCKL